MLWVGLFIVGLLVLLAGLVPAILNGLRGGSAFVIALGFIMFGAGTAGVIVKPSFLALKMPRLVFSESADASSGGSTTASAGDDATPDTGKSASASAADAPPASKDESQLKPAELPQPVTVTTTTVVGNEVDPLAAPSAAGGAAPAPAAQAAAQPMPPVPAAPEAPPVDDMLALAPEQAKDEAAFTSVLSSARDKYEKADDAAREAMQSTRATAICRAVNKPAVNAWVGRVRELDRDAGGRMMISIGLPGGSLVKTWNNAMSDVEDKTLVLAGTPLAATFGSLKVGDAIRFSGQFFLDEPDCYRSSRISLDQSMLEPSFLFRFTEAEKI